MYRTHNVLGGTFANSTPTIPEFVASSPPKASVKYDLTVN
jgi:hypothetical protein